MLFGPNAPMRFDPRRASYISDEHDFYKPVGWHELAPVVDMRVARRSIGQAMIKKQKHVLHVALLVSLMIGVDISLLSIPNNPT